MKFEELIKKLCDISDAQARIAKAGDNYSFRILLAEQERLIKSECIPILIKFINQDGVPTHMLANKEDCPNKRNGCCGSCDRFVHFDFRDTYTFSNGEKVPYGSECEKELLEYIDKTLGIPHPSCLQLFSAMPQDVFVGYCFKEVEEPTKSDDCMAIVNFQGYDDKLKYIMDRYADAFKRDDKETMERFSKECNIAREVMEHILAERKGDKK